MKNCIVAFALFVFCAVAGSVACGQSVRNMSPQALSWAESSGAVSASATGRLSTSSPYLTDVYPSHYAALYSLDVPEACRVDIFMGSAVFNTYLVLLDSNYSTLNFNDDTSVDYMGYQYVSAMSGINLSQGRYYLLAASVQSLSATGGEFSVKVSLLRDTVPLAEAEPIVRIDEVSLRQGVVVSGRLSLCSNYVTMANQTLVGKVFAMSFEHAQNVHIAGVPDNCILEIYRHNLVDGSVAYEQLLVNGSWLVAASADAEYLVVVTKIYSSADLLEFNISLSAGNVDLLRNIPPTVVSLAALPADFDLNETADDYAASDLTFSGPVKVFSISLVLPATLRMVFQSASFFSYNMYCIYDEHYNMISTEYYDMVSFVEGDTLNAHFDEGTYYVVLPTSNAVLRMSRTTAIPTSEMSMTAITSGQQVVDRVHADDPLVYLPGRVEAYRSRGYSISALSGQVLQMNGGLGLKVYDADFNQLRLPYMVQRSGEFYVLAQTSQLVDSNYRFSITAVDADTLYVSAATGNDSRSGRTPQTAVATLARAAELSQGMGVYMLMDDMRLHGGSTIELKCASILPYNANITVSGPIEYTFVSGITLALGDKQGRHRLVFDSVIGYQTLVNATNLEVYNCNFTNNRCYNMLVANNAVLSNTTISGNEAYKAVVQVGSGYIDGGSFGSNRGFTNAPEFSVPEATDDMRGGIVVGDSLTVGRDFAMTDGCIILHSGAVVQCRQEPRRPKVAELLPVAVEGRTTTAHYYDGRRVVGLNGFCAHKFDMAQCHTSRWYIHYDGTIHTTAAIANAANSVQLSLYPNPATDKLVLECPDLAAGQLQLRLFSADGRMLMQKSIASPQTQLDCRWLPAGVYVLQLSNGAQTLGTKRFVKQ